MKQPELGHRLTDLRKEKNMTQEELVESCNVSVRTIQRIESGEVTPRTSTIRILLAALGEDFDSFKNHVTPSRSNENLHSLEQWLNVAWISGIMYFILGFLDASFEYARFENQGDLDTSNLVYIPSKILYYFSYCFFMMGLIKLADFFNTYLLKIAGYLMIGLFGISTFLDIISLFMEISDYNLIFVGIGESMSVGVVGILLGLGLMRLQDGMGILAKASGVLEIIAAFFFLVVILFWIGYIMLIPATVLEIILLFKAAEYIRTEIQSA